MKVDDEAVDAMKQINTVFKSTPTDDFLHAGHTEITNSCMFAELLIRHL